MTRFIIKFSDDCNLTYDLIDHSITKSWSNLIVNHTIADLCLNNHYIGFSSKELAQGKIDRLNYLADLINLRVPERVIKHPLTVTEYSAALSAMHVHFPDLKNDENYQDIWPLLTEYNDIIHWLESSLPYLENSSSFRITLDFNKSNTSFLPIPEDAYDLFTYECNFGDLMLHYTHVGKNASEIFITQDFACPKDQFVPQRTYSASVRMHFFDYFHETDLQKEQLQSSWESFYETRGGKEFWGIEVTDPKIAFGFMKIGSLSEITLVGKQYPIPKTPSELNNFRNILVNTKVTDWKVE